MKKIYWIVAILVLALGGYFLFSRQRNGGGLTLGTSTKSTGTFSGFDNFFSGLQSKPNYTPQNGSGNNTGEIITAAAGALTPLYNFGKAIFGSSTPSYAVPTATQAQAVAATTDFNNYYGWNGTGFDFGGSAASDPLAYDFGGYTPAY
jgi:hypothetical protein